MQKFFTMQHNVGSLIYADACCCYMIDYGTTYCYPLCSMIFHVSACPNHQLKWTTPIISCANDDFFWAFGYELDLMNSRQEEKQIVRDEKHQKKNKNLFLFNDFSCDVLFLYHWYLLDHQVHHYRFPMLLQYGIHWRSPKQQQYLRKLQFLWF